MALQTQKEKETIKSNHQNPLASTLLHLPIAEIRDDFIVLKNGGLRAILKTSSINLNLKSEEEQNSIIYAYQHFLNTLEFPIQICIRSQRLNIDEYIQSMRGKAKVQKNELLKRQTIEYADYIQKLIEYADIMEKSFYVIIPYNPMRANQKNMFSAFFERLKVADSIMDIKKRRAEFEDLKKGINQRINLVKAGLQNCGISVEEIKTMDIIKLFYEIYNPVSSRYQNLSKIDELNLEKN